MALGKRLAAVGVPRAGADRRHNQRGMLLPLLPGARKVEEGVTGESAVLAGLGIEFRLSSDVGLGLRLLSRNIGKNLVCLPDLRRVGGES